MSRIYAVPFAGATVTNAGGNADLWEFLPADDKPIKLRGFLFGQISEVADAAEEGVEIQIIRMSATVTSSNGSSVTPVPLDSADAAAGFTAETNGATVATTSGAATIVASIPWNIRSSPFEHWAPDERFAVKAKQGEGLFIRLITTVADDITFGGVAWVEEE
jgi:hypothetical protein